MSTVPSPKAQLRVHVRWMIRRDMPEVLAIEHAGFEFPWCEEEFLRVLRQRNCIGMVAELGERVVGFMIYELHKNKLFVLDFAVHPEFRRMGIGRQLIARLIGKLSSHRRTKIVLQTRETNLAAQFFYRSQNFRGGRSRVLPGHGRRRLLDALRPRRVPRRDSCFERTGLATRKLIDPPRGS